MITLPPSLIDDSFLNVSDRWRLIINVCGLVHQGPVCVLVFWLQIVLGNFALFHHSVCDYLFRCDVSQIRQQLLSGPNLCLHFGTAALTMRFCESKTGLSPEIFLFLLIVSRDFSVAIDLCQWLMCGVYNFDSLKPHFYIVKLGFTGLYIIFLTSA